MRNKIFLLAAILLTVFVFSYLKLINKGSLVTSTTPSTEATVTAPDQSQDTATPPKPSQKTGLRVSWAVIRDMAKLRLISNLEDGLASSDAKKQYGCSQLTSAAFYTKEGTHIGYFVQDGEVVSKSKNSSLFNSYFAVVGQKALITQTEPENARFAFQTGPLVMHNKQPITLASANTDEARRLVAAIDASGNVVLMVFYNQEAVFSGPTLKELPQLVMQVSNDKNLKIVDATNLDGGSASSFITSDLSLQELSKVGSFLCFSEDLTLY